MVKKTRCPLNTDFVTKILNGLQRFLLTFFFLICCRPSKCGGSERNSERSGCQNNLANDICFEFLKMWSIVLDSEHICSRWPPACSAVFVAYLSEKGQSKLSLYIVPSVISQCCTYGIYVLFSSHHCFYQALTLVTLLFLSSLVSGEMCLCYFYTQMTSCTEGLTIPALFDLV